MTVKFTEVLTSKFKLLAKFAQGSTNGSQSAGGKKGGQSTKAKAEEMGRDENGNLKYYQGIGSQGGIEGGESTKEQAEQMGRDEEGKLNFYKDIGAQGGQKSKRGPGTNSKQDEDEEEA